MLPRHSIDHHTLPAPAWQERILLGGFEPFSTVDWPGKRSATLFLRGCPWRCGYCHNPHLQARHRDQTLSWPTIAAQLEARRGQLDGVVFSGGEPTADRTLPDAIGAVRAMGFGVGLHTGGAYPERLEKLLPLVDWVGFDLKSDGAHYDALTGAPGSGQRATESARLICASGIDHEFRLTWHPDLVSEDSAILAAHFAKHLGARRFVLQSYRPEGVSNAALGAAHAPSATLLATAHALFGPAFTLRGELCGLATHLA